MLFYYIATITWASITLATLPTDYVEPADNGNGQKVEHPSKNRMHRSTQILQPYTFEQLSSKSVHTSATHNPLVANSLNFGSDFNVSPHSRSTEISDRSTLPKLSDKLVPVQNGQNHDDSSAVLPNDELLLLQNAGNFGRRVHVSPAGETGLKGIESRQFEELSWIKKNNVAARTVDNERDSSGASILSEEKDKKERRLNQYLYSQQLFTPKSSTRANVSDKSSRNFADFSATSASPNTTNRASHVSSTTSADLSSNGNGPINNESVDREYNNTIEANIDSSRYFINGMVNAKLKVTSPRFINYDENNLPTIKERRQPIDSETTVATTTGSFSRPIVVAEITRYNSSAYVTNSKCADNNVGFKCSDALRTASSMDAFFATSKPQVEGHLTTSSVILNPIQAGVALVNEEEAYLLNKNNASPPMPAEEDVDADFQDVSTSDGQMIMASVDELDSRSSYGKAIAIPSEQQHEQRKKTNGIAATMDFDHEIEIQKSVEVYHNMPVQEIHYPVEVAVSQVPYIENLKAQEIKLTNDPSDIGFTRQTDLQGIDQKLSNGIGGRNDLPACNVQQAANVAQQTYKVVQGNAQTEHSSCRHLTNDFSNVLGTSQRSNFRGVDAPILRQVDDSSIVPERSNLQKIQSEASNNNNNNRYGFRLNHDYEREGLNSPVTYVLKASKEIATPIVPFATRLIQKPVDTRLSSDPNEIGKIVEKDVRVSQSLLAELTRLVDKPDNNVVDDKVENKVRELLSIRLPPSNPPEVEKVVVKKIHVPQPYPVHIQVPVDRIIEKIVKVPQPYVVEKIVHNNIPYPVEVATIVEKNDSQLNGNLGKIIERRVPQLFPVHVRVFQPYPVEEAIEKQVPYTVEKILENTVQPIEKIVKENLRVPQLYPVQVGPVVERKVPYFILKGRNLYPAYRTAQVPLYSLPMFGNQRANVDSLHQFQGYAYGKSPINFDERGVDVNKRNLPFGSLSNLKQQPSNQEFSKKLRSQFALASSTPVLAHSTANNSGPASYRRHRIRGSSKNDPKVNDVSSPSSQYPTNFQNQGHLGTLRTSSSHSTAVTRPSMMSTSFRESRQPKAQFQTATGNFRQSKMEYGFKPPMVPSVQYDEDTATKVEN